MNRSRKIVQILEGFKLGTLGAGKKRFVEDPPTFSAVSKKSSVVRTKPEDMGYKIQRDRWHKGRAYPDNDNFFEFAMSWTEVNSVTKDRIKFCMYLYLAGNYVITVYGGPNLKLVKDSLTFAENEDFFLNFELDNDDLNSANTLFNSFWKEIKWEGSFGLALAKEFLGDSWKLGNSSRNFKDYFERTTGTSEYSQFVKT
jgi:hypothetical protein